MAHIVTKENQPGRPREKTQKRRKTSTGTGDRPDRAQRLGGTKNADRTEGRIPYHAVCGNEAVGAPGFEPGTSRTQTVRASQLRYAPNISDYNAKYPFCQSDAKRSSSIPRSTVVIR